MTPAPGLEEKIYGGKNGECDECRRSVRVSVGMGSVQGEVDPGRQVRYRTGVGESKATARSENEVGNRMLEMGWASHGDRWESKGRSGSRQMKEGEEWLRGRW